MTTPSDWLLARFDRAADDPDRRHTTHERDLFQLIDDHPGSECEPVPDGCKRMWVLGAARWPRPFHGRDLGEVDEVQRRLRRTAA